MILGYARVSTDGQSVAAQIKELRDASGAKSDRAELRRALAVLDADDVLLVTRLDRLAHYPRAAAIGFRHGEAARRSPRHAAQGIEAHSRRACVVSCIVWQAGRNMKSHPPWTAGDPMHEWPARNSAPLLHPTRRRTPRTLRIGLFP
jgi:hypothetical protein